MNNSNDKKTENFKLAVKGEKTSPKNLLALAAICIRIDANFLKHDFKKKWAFRYDFFLAGKWVRTEEKG